MDPLEIDPNFEPQTRARSNTWPLPRPENFVDQEVDEKPAIVPVHLHGQISVDLVSQVPKKNSSRRNAWGNMSYADLITQAIQSSPDKRLTLSQIYEWMVQNVPYFKDKGDSNSSAGWKNSIRHNLSLHNRFMRVQNEGTGKSSWWMINPDAKPGKAARRRATSMETQKYEKKRGRVKKKVEALRNGQTAATPSPSSSVSEGLDMFPESPVHHGFHDDFRPRASSNASSCGGRLSPIPAVESDMHDSEVPPLSPIPWNVDMAHVYDTPPPTALPAPQTPTTPSASGFNTDQLVETLAESMKLRNHSGDSCFMSTDCAMKPNGRSQLNTGGSYTVTYQTPYGSNGSVTRNSNGSEYRPPPYHSPVSQDSSPLASSMNVISSRRSPSQQGLESTVNGSTYTLTNLQTISSVSHTNGSNSNQSLSPGLEPLVQSSAFANQRPTPPLSFCSVNEDSVLRGGQVMYKDIKDTRTLLQQQQHASPPHQQLPLPNQSAYHPQPQHHHHQLHQHSSSTSLTNTASHVVGHLLGHLPNDLDFDTVQGGLECDVDQVIRHELSVDGNLDFNFDPMAATSNASVVHHPASIATTRPWVH